MKVHIHIEHEDLRTLIDMIDYEMKAVTDNDAVLRIVDALYEAWSQVFLRVPNDPT